VTDVEIRQPVPLRTLPNIELAAVGTWKASTGETTFTLQDFTDAVAALDCPGVRNPVIKLGHDEEDSTSGVRWDGEPAVGWVANMRVAGAKIVGDLTGLPAWLADADENGLSVLAAAYPDRSIEIYRPFVCQIGHAHPSVITALSLLGVYAPGVGVLKSMQDVYAVFTTTDEEPAKAAAGSRRLTVSVRLAAAEPREPTAIERQSGVDFAQVAEQHAAALDALLEQWPEIADEQRAELAAQIETAVDENPDGLGALTVTSAAAAILLTTAMTELAAKSAAAQVAEAQQQGARLAMPEITEETVRADAEAVAAAMAASTASTAGRTAAQALGTGDGRHISTTTLDHLAKLSDRFLRDQLGGALSTAQARGRYAALYGYDGPVDVYASEINDTNACAPCRAIDGRRFDSLDEAMGQYGAGKYVGCLGGARCRGQLVAVFGQAASARLSTTVRMTMGGPMGTTTGGAVKASVSVEDISRKYYESAGYSMWIAAMHVDPLELIAADDATGKHYRIPVELKGEEFTFGEPQEVAITYQDVKAAAASLPVRFSDRKAAFAAAGKREDGSDIVAKDVSPAGAAIRKAAERTAAANATVVETEVPVAAPAEETQTPDADPATGPTTTPKEASVDAAKMREALGLGPDASDDEVREAFATQVSASAPKTEPAPNPLAVLTAKLPAGEQPILVDPENYKALLSMAVKGEQAYAEVQKTRRDQVLSAAAKEGRFPVSRLSTYKEMWDKNPEATEAYINLMPKNTVPTLAAGVLGAEINQNEVDQVYAAYMGEAAH
jgi:hypothetical protein